MKSKILTFKRLLPLVALVMASQSARAAGTIQTFGYTGADQTFVVPAGVTSIFFEVLGARGGDGAGTAVGGSGHLITGNLSVAVGGTLTIRVGGAGDTGGAYGGGGSNAAGGGGGGLSGIYVTTAPLLIAGGGGGAGSSYDGGSAGGGGAGGTGGGGIIIITDFFGDGAGGSGGDSGGLGGSGGEKGINGIDGAAGSPGQGGQGGGYFLLGPAGDVDPSGGGGGGGYLGGGGGGAGGQGGTYSGGGGGAGSAFASGETSGVTMSVANGTNYALTAGNGSIVISYIAVPESGSAALVIIAGLGLLGVRGRGKPLSPALRSGLTAVSGATRESKFLQ